MSANQALERLIEPAVAANGCYLERVISRTAGKRRLVRVVVDHPGGLPLDLVAQVSRAVSRVLDTSDALGDAPYVLEVTSPGVDRPLTLPRHWEGNLGRLVEVTTAAGDAVSGRITSADPTGAELDVAGHARRFEYADVARAVIQIEFSRMATADLGDDVEQSNLAEFVGEPPGTYDPANEDE